MPLVPGQVIESKYRIIRLVGQGGMGSVYEGENLRIGRRVAIKVLNAQFATRPELMVRFEREARAAARIGSVNICDVLDLGDLPNNERFIVMEFLEGYSLEQRLTQRGRLSIDEFVPIAYELLEALATMHDAGVIHRDLKPANVHLAKISSGRGEVVKVLDFGVSKVLPLDGNAPEMTATGVLMGTPLYMSPEQAKGARDIDARSDLYSASVIFYRALAGAYPYTGRNFNELLFKIVLDQPRPLCELAPDLDPELAAIVHQGLAHARESRHASARAYQEAIVVWARRSMPGTLVPLRVSQREGVLPVIPSSRLSESHETTTAWSADGRSAALRDTLAAPDQAAERLQQGFAPGAVAPSLPPPRVLDPPYSVPRRSIIPWVFAAVVLLVALGAGYGMLLRSNAVPATVEPATTASEWASPPPPPSIAPLVEPDGSLLGRDREPSEPPEPIVGRQPPRRTSVPSRTPVPGGLRNEESPPSPSPAASESPASPPPPPSAAPTAKKRKYRTTLD